MERQRGWITFEGEARLRKLLLKQEQEELNRLAAASRKKAESAYEKARKHCGDGGVDQWGYDYKPKHEPGTVIPLEEIIVDGEPVCVWRRYRKVERDPELELEDRKEDPAFYVDIEESLKAGRITAQEAERRKRLRDQQELKVIKSKIANQKYSWIVTLIIIILITIGAIMNRGCGYDPFV